MFDGLRQRVLFVMRVPHDPAPPFGAPGSTRVFRAGRNYFKLRLLGWGFAQLAVLGGIIFWAVVLRDVEQTARTQKQSRATIPPLSPAALAETVTAAGTTEPSPVKTKKKRSNRINGWAGFKQGLVEIALRLPEWAFPVIWLLKVVGFVAYLAQIPFTYALRRLDYELRWYIVTDRSLRIRAGLVRLQESTMSFANLQQVEVKQNPIQRLLGLADVHVQSAGGGEKTPDHGHEDTSLHTGIFHSVDNAHEIRDLILQRLRQFREAGLGDPDDHHTPVPPALPGAPASGEAAALAAAREVLAEARALRAALS